MSLSEPAALLEFLPAPAFLTDPTGRLASINANARRALPWLGQEAVGQWLTALAAPEDYKAIERYLHEWAAPNRGASAPPLLQTTVTLRTVRFDPNPIWGDRGELSGHLWRCSPSVGHQAREQLEVMVDSLNDAIICIDDEFRIAFLNRSAEVSFGCSAKTAIGLHIDLFPTLATALKQINLGTIESDPNLFKNAHQIEGRRPNGEVFPMEATLSSALIGGRHFYTAVIRDISAQMEMEQALFQSQKNQAIGALASGVAHDFNNILTAILSQLDCVAWVDGIPEHLKECVILAQNSARRGAELVSKLLTFSRSSEFKLVLLDLNKLVEEVLDMLRRSIAPQIQIQHYTDDSDSWLVKGDNTQLMQLIMNLCINARDAMKSGGVLTVRVRKTQFEPADARAPRRAGEFVRLSVRDTGEGMSPEVLARLGEPYFTTKEAGKGTGLGLSIAYSVVAEHKGWIEVESSPGEGAEFHVFFPVGTEKDVVQTEDFSDIESVSEGALEGEERILVVDDDEVIRLVVRAVLTYRGYSVTEAATGEEALSLFRASPRDFDLMLLDLHMPKGSGWDVLRKIREQASKLPVIIMSGGATEGDYTRAKELGASVFMRKPFENRDLTRIVRKVLNRGPSPVEAQP